jgi:hypothetical protein
MQRRCRIQLWALALLVSATAVIPLVADDAEVDKAAQQRVDNLFEEFRLGEFDTNEFPRMQFDDIPALLERADSEKRLKNFPRHSGSSQYEEECSEGMVALWLIEGIRKGKGFPSLNSLCLREADARNDDDWTKASERNHKDVAKLYRAWWKKARELPRKEARKLDPLKDSGLNWH